MAIREIRRDVHPGMKIEIVELIDDFGTSVLVQQPLTPAQDLEAHDYTIGERTGNTLLDWHDANLEDVAREMLKNETAFTKFAAMRGHNIKAMVRKSSGRVVLQDPLADYKGCCGD